MRFSALNKKIQNILNKRLNIYQVALLCFLLFAFIISLFIFLRSPDQKEWILYHFYYTPLYSILKEHLYASLIINGISVFSILIVSLLLEWQCIKKILRKKANLKDRIMYLVFMLLILVGIYLFSNKFISDVKFTNKKKYLVEYSYLSKIEKIERKSNKGSRSYDYRLYTNTLTGKYKNSYRYLNLNTYQYKNLEMKKDELKSKNINTDSIPMTIYYLPNTKLILEYEIFKPK